jgi:hypothetical protein
LALLLIELASLFSILKVNVNVDPMLGSDSTFIFPPNISTIMRLMQSPRPTPFVFDSLVFFIVPKSLKSFFFSLLFIPIPLSFTLISTKLSYYSSFWINLQPMLIVPSLFVNLIALDNRFKRTYYSLLISLLIMVLGSLNQSKTDSILIYLL